ncbi:MAG TPA: DNA translocase FtsK [Thermodesulfovibrionia bacterium]|nr:DNA translocase FtsK [Thermodesulfovibrionia bacterium]
MDKLNRVKEEIAGIVLIISAIAVLISLISHNALDPSPFTSSGVWESHNLLGPFGAYISDILFQAVGYSAYIFPFVLGYYGANRTFAGQKRPKLTAVAGTIIFIISLSSLLSLMLTMGYSFSPGGVTGGLIASHAVKMFSLAGSYLIFISVILLTIMFLFPVSVIELAKKVSAMVRLGLNRAKSALSMAATATLQFREKIRGFIRKRRLANARDEATQEEALVEEIISEIAVEEAGSNGGFQRAESAALAEEEVEDFVGQSPQAELTVKKVKEKPDRAEVTKKQEPRKEVAIARGLVNPYCLPECPKGAIAVADAASENYQLPSLDLLADPPASRITPSKDELLSKSRLLEKKLADFDIQGIVTQVYPGPVVAMFEFEPAPGVKINKIVSLSDDLALALKAMSVRVSPIPGKSALGIEVPNKAKEDVYLKEILAAPVFQNHPARLVIALGKDIFGNPVVTDLARMPHLLVAGATGSGKSVGMNSMILSILYRATPKEVRMLMIDPKLLELSIYNDIPHLLLPVITTPKGAVEALKRIVLEMEYRYKLLAEKGSRNIDSFNSKIESEEEFLPYIVIFIDELADLMLVSKREVEEPIARIAQMARAAGIHMILATQRPSVDVITGVIKANFPSRISFQVSSKVDSRTILDTMGAEKLLGKGDMLFTTPGHKMMRAHGAYVSEEEISEIVDYIKSQQRPDYSAFQASMSGDPVDEEDSVPVKEGRDTIYEKAVEVVVSSNQASISYIQRRLKIGYNKAARIMEMMEEDGIVGPPVEAGKSREILIRRS